MLLLDVAAGAAWTREQAASFASFPVLTLVISDFSDYERPIRKTLAYIMLPGHMALSSRDIIIFTINLF